MMRIVTMVLAFPCLAGCVSTVSVEKATQSSDGIRYNLPEVMIRVIPKADGTMTVEKLYLPDPNQEYAITTKSFLGNYTIDINRSEEGFLELVSFEPDSTAVAKQLATSVGNVRAAEIDAQLAKAKADATEAKGAAEKAKAALETADKARKEAAMAVDVAQRKLALLSARAGQPNPPANLQDQIFAAQLALVEAEARRDAAERGYAALAAAVAADSGVASPGGAPSGNLRRAAIARTKASPPPRAVAQAAPAASTRPKYPNSMFYRVEMTKDDNVRLIEAFPQKPLDTWKAPKSDPLEDVEAMLLPSEVLVRPDRDNKGLSTIVKATHEMLTLKVDDFVTAAGKPVTPQPILSLIDRTTVRIELPKDLAAGDYLLDLTMTIGTSKASKSSEHSLTIRIER